jgi:hypothetical protein
MQIPDFMKEEDLEGLLWQKSSTTFALEVDKKGKTHAQMYEVLHEIVKGKYIDIESSRCPSIPCENAFLSQK